MSNDGAVLVNAPVPTHVRELAGTTNGNDEERKNYTPGEWADKLSKVAEKINFADALAQLEMRFNQMEETFGSRCDQIEARLLLSEEKNDTFINTVLEAAIEKIADQHRELKLANVNFSTGSVEACTAESGSAAFGSTSNLSSPVQVLRPDPIHAGSPKERTKPSRMASDLSFSTEIESILKGLLASRRNGQPASSKADSPLQKEDVTTCVSRMSTQTEAPGTEWNAVSRGSSAATKPTDSVGPEPFGEMYDAFGRALAAKCFMRTMEVLEGKAPTPSQDMQRRGADTMAHAQHQGLGMKTRMSAMAPGVPYPSSHVSPHLNLFSGMHALGSTHPQQSLPRPASMDVDNPPSIFSKPDSISCVSLGSPLTQPRAGTVSVPVPRARSMDMQHPQATKPIVPLGSPHALCRAGSCSVPMPRRSPTDMQSSLVNMTVAPSTAMFPSGSPLAESRGGSLSVSAAMPCIPSPDMHNFQGKLTVAASMPICPLGSPFAESRGGSVSVSAPRMASSDMHNFQGNLTVAANTPIALMGSPPTESRGGSLSPMKRSISPTQHNKTVVTHAPPVPLGSPPTQSRAGSSNVPMICAPSQNMQNLQSNKPAATSAPISPSGLPFTQIRAGSPGQLRAPLTRSRSPESHSIPSNAAAMASAPMVPLEPQPKSRGVLPVQQVGSNFAAAMGVPPSHMALIRSTESSRPGVGVPRTSLPVRMRSPGRVPDNRPQFAKQAARPKQFRP